MDEALAPFYYQICNGLAHGGKSLMLGPVSGAHSQYQNRVTMWAPLHSSIYIYVFRYHHTLCRSPMVLYMRALMYLIITFVS